MNELQLAQLLDQARSFANEGKHLHAEQIYHRLIREEPTFVQAYLELASLHAENRNYHGGIAVLAKAQKEFPTNDDVTFQLGNLHLQAEDYDKALTQYQRLARKGLPQAHFNMGIVYFHKSNIKLAEEHFRLTLKLSPQFPKIHESLGELLVRRGAFAEAITHLKRGIATDPYSWVSHHLIGLAYHALSDLKNAYNEFVLAIEMDPNEAHSWQKCGEVLLDMKRFEEAERYLQKALDLDPQFAEALASFGQLYLLQGDPARSVEFFNRALNVDPQNRRARFGRLQSRLSHHEPKAHRTRSEK